MQKIVILDANAILRYLMHDEKEQADEVEVILNTEKILILPEVAAEVIYVLTKHYKLPHDFVSGIVFAFIKIFNSENSILMSAVETFGKTKLDFVDCLLYEYSKMPFYEILTFDMQLKKLIAENA